MSPYNDVSNYRVDDRNDTQTLTVSSVARVAMKKRCSQRLMNMSHQIIHSYNTGSFPVYLGRYSCDFFGFAARNYNVAQGLSLVRPRY